MTNQKNHVVLPKKKRKLNNLFFIQFTDNYLNENKLTLIVTIKPIYTNNVEFEENKHEFIPIINIK